MARPLTVLGATLQIAKCDGSTVSLRSAMTSLNIEGDGARTGRGAEKNIRTRARKVNILHFLCNSIIDALLHEV